MNTGISVAVIGAKKYDNVETVYNKLDKYIEKLQSQGGIKELIVVRNAGVSAIVKQYANEKKIKLKVVTPNWDKVGNTAFFEAVDSVIKSSSMVIIIHDDTEQVYKDSTDKALLMLKQVRISKVPSTENTIKF